nr:spore coat associated protein CotJA [Paenibacillus sp. B01]
MRLQAARGMFGGGQGGYAGQPGGVAYGAPAYAGGAPGFGAPQQAYRSEAELAAAAAYGQPAYGAATGYGAQAGAAGELPPPGVPGAGYREWLPFRGACDPCPPIGVRRYVIPPNQYILYQPTGLPQYPLEEALRLGTLWPALYSPYEPGCGRS